MARSVDANAAPSPTSPVERRRARDERIAEAVQRVPKLSISIHAADTRADLHALLDVLLDLKKIDSTEQELDSPDFGGAETRAKREARGIAWRLLHGCLGWTEPPQPSFGVASFQPKTAKLINHTKPPHEWRDLEAMPYAWRIEALFRLHRAPNILPRQMLDTLIGALNALNDGSGRVPSVLTPDREPGHGRNPRLAMLLEERLWLWIAYQQGAGHSVDEARSMVADKAGCSTKNVDAWRSAWQKRSTKEQVAFELATARQAGRAGHQQAFSLPALEGDMPTIAKRWKAARTPAKAEMPKKARQNLG
jgi:hypothetical protein